MNPIPLLTAGALPVAPAPSTLVRSAPLKEVVKKKPKNNTKGVPERDQCGTPSYAVNPLAWYLPKDKIIWESAAGEGLLVDALELRGFKVVRSEIMEGQDYFVYEPPEWDIQVTNVPFSVKYEWFQRACLLEKPFALLMPSDVLFAAQGQRIITQYNVEVLTPSQRINYKMPNKGWDGSAQMSTSWFTRGFNIGRMLTFVELDKPKKAKKAKPKYVDNSQLSLFA